jgi:hypothetical protein
MILQASCYYWGFCPPSLNLRKQQHPQTPDAQGKYFELKERFNLKSYQRKYSTGNHL